MGTTIAVLGANGFIGKAVADLLTELGVEVRRISAPRLRWPYEPPTSLGDPLPKPGQQDVEKLAARLDGAQAVINAAGVADADAPSTRALFGANALMPLVAAQAAAAVGARRFLHVSSIVVQGNRPLDETMTMAPFSPYSLSRALGETMLLREPEVETSVYRPSPVQGPHKPNTRSIIRVARSRLACVAGDGSLPTPQALVDEVSEGIVHATRYERSLPPVLLHPHNGMTTGMLLTLLGGKEPRRLPLRPTRHAVNGILRTTRGNVWAHGNARRLEMLLLGRRQSEGWLPTHGFAPRVDATKWRLLTRSATSV
jgi:UDP-glucose 4-epimerase